MFSYYIKWRPGNVTWNMISSENPKHTMLALKDCAVDYACVTELLQSLFYICDKQISTMTQNFNPYL